jgi:hypothetical protein
MKTILAMSFAITMAAPALADNDSSPCGAQYCPSSADKMQKRLNDAWWSSVTTGEEKAKIGEFIRSTGFTDTAGRWGEAANAYFNWRAMTHGYSIDLSDEAAKVADARAVAQKKARFSTMRKAAEGAVRGKLIDPSSAEFEWPYGFTHATWKPIFQRRLEGMVICGSVNAKNRMGGYVGRSSFVVVLDDSNTVIFTDLDSGRGLGLVDVQCKKAASMFPSPQEGMLDNQLVANAGAVDLADELAKLATLRDKGVLTSAEFDAQKTKLLSK